MGTRRPQATPCNYVRLSDQDRPEVFLLLGLNRQWWDVTNCSYSVTFIWVYEKHKLTYYFDFAVPFAFTRVQHFDVTPLSLECNLQLLYLPLVVSLNEEPNMHQTQSYSLCTSEISCIYTSFVVLASFSFCWGMLRRLLLMLPTAPADYSSSSPVLLPIWTPAS